VSLFRIAAIAAALLSNPNIVEAAQPASCATNDAPARIARAERPQYPEIAKLIGLSGTARIRVDLSETGSLLGAYVAVSSGSSILDRAAIRTASEMKYAAQIRSCVATPGSYAVEVEFAD
jgi:protein TonB